MNTTVSINRNSGIDVLKYLCSFLVICLHSDFYGKTYIDVISRIAVPLFFMITGYYFTNLKEKNKIFSQFKKILILMLTGNLFFSIVDVIHSIDSYAPFLNYKALFRFLILNERPVWTHLWYLGALLYGFFLMFLADKWHLRKKLYVFIPLLLCTNLVLGNYSTLILGNPLPIAYSRNFLFMAFSFLLLGDCLYQVQNNVKPKNSGLGLLLIISLIITFAEQRVLLYFNAYDNRDFFFGTTLTVICIFLLILQNPKHFSAPLAKKIGYLGQKLSPVIYILHPLIIYLIGQLLETLKNKYPLLLAIYFYSAPIIILIITTLISALITTLIYKIIKKHP